MSRKMRLPSCSSHRGLVLLLLLAHTRSGEPAAAAEEDTGGGGAEDRWEIRRGDPSPFLGVPIYYGDWVPINNAKSTIQAVAAR